MNAKRLVELQNKLDKSGLKENPVITDEELKELDKGLKFLCDYFNAMDESTIFMRLHLRGRGVRSLLRARGII